MPAQKKPADRRQNRAKPKPPDERSLVPIKVPAPPDGLTDGVVEWWEALWSTELIQATHAETDMQSLRRLAQMYAKLERVESELFEADWIVEGSQGQDRLNPLFSLWEKLVDKVQSLEDRFGLNPKARLALGLQLGQVRRTLDDLNRRLRGDDDDSDDPRLAVVASDAD